jgi:hypothetical protein
MRNKLIGGVLFLQLRRKAVACGSSYESFAYDCISTVSSGTFNSPPRAISRDMWRRSQEFDTRPFGPPRNTSLYDYDADAGGYTAFFGNSNGMAANFKKLTDLAAGIWTDKYTTPFPHCIIVTLFRPSLIVLL